MDVQMIQLAWQCLSEHYPQIGAALLQIVGIASVIAKVGSAMNIGQGTPAPNAGATSGLLAGLMGLANKVGLNK